jgi:MFS family permease
VDHRGLRPGDGRWAAHRGRLGDLYDRKRVLLAGLGGFLAASTAYALATGPAELIAARAVQGGAGAVMVPQVFG